MTFEVIFGVGYSTASCPGVTLCHFRVCMPAGVTRLVQPSLATLLMFLPAFKRSCKAVSFLQKNKKLKKEQDTDTIHIPKSMQCNRQWPWKNIVIVLLFTFTILLTGHCFICFTLYDYYYYFMGWCIYLIVYFLYWKFEKNNFLLVWL